MANLAHVLAMMGTGRSCAVCAEYVADDEEARLTGCITSRPHVAHRRCVQAWVAAVCGALPRDGSTPCFVCRVSPCTHTNLDTVLIDPECCHCIDWHMAALRPSVRARDTDINTTQLPLRVKFVTGPITSNGLFPHVKKNDGSWGRNAVATMINRSAVAARARTSKVTHL